MLCPLCSGKRPVCIHEYKILPKILTREFFGPSYNIFVGRAGYPHVSIGPIASTEEDMLLDNPSLWFGLPYERLIEMRYLLIRAKATAHVKNNSRFIEENQLISMSDPIDVEMTFKKDPVYRFESSSITTPTGPIADIEKMKIAENPKISYKLDRIVGDDLKAVDASIAIYNIEKDVYKASSILSSGALGYNKKIVPTKWSITAIDDILAKNMVRSVKDYAHVKEFIVHSGEYLGNHFEILLMPGNWEFENFESWTENQAINIIGEHEGYMGRKRYAYSQSGGYYASRFGVIESLHENKRQAKVIVFREIYDSYTVHMGVWVVRENVRNAMKNHPNKFSVLDQALVDINTRLRIPIASYLKKSIILNQKRLSDF